jgi:hypothetical protein
MILNLSFKALILEVLPLIWRVIPLEACFFGVSHCYGLILMPVDIEVLSFFDVLILKSILKLP